MKKILYPKDQIRLWANEGKTQKWIGEQLGVSASAICQLFQKMGIHRASSRGHGENHHNWKGGRVVRPDGYVLVYSPEHTRSKRNHYCYEHRLVVEQNLGRSLEPNEVVHHINGERGDNRLENLIVFQSNASHLKHELTGSQKTMTEDGSRRVSEANRRRAGKPLNLSPQERERRRQSALRRHANNRRRKALDAAQKQETPDRLTA